MVRLLFLDKKYEVWKVCFSPYDQLDIRRNRYMQMLGNMSVP
jgi:hypothetical protein